MSDLATHETLGWLGTLGSKVPMLTTVETTLIFAMTAFDLRFALEECFNFILGNMVQRHKMLTDKECKSNKGISEEPIIMTIYSPTCPDLTIID